MAVSGSLSIPFAPSRNWCKYVRLLSAERAGKQCAYSLHCPPTIKSRASGSFFALLPHPQSPDLPIADHSCPMLSCPSPSMTATTRRPWTLCPWDSAGAQVSGRGRGWERREGGLRKKGWGKWVCLPQSLPKTPTSQPPTASRPPGSPFPEPCSCLGHFHFYLLRVVSGSRQVGNALLMTPAPRGDHSGKSCNVLSATLIREAHQELLRRDSLPPGPCPAY